MNIPWIPFRWEGADFGEQHFDKAAMFVMAELPEVGLSGLFQFDLGAPSSVLYENDVKDVLPELQARINPDKHIMLNGVEYPVISTPLILNPQIRQEHIGLLKDFGEGDGGVTEDGVRVLGTIGADMVAGKCLLIDFPQERLAIVEQAPAELVEEAIFTPMQKSPFGHTLLQVTVDGEQKWVMFDTGSSIFELLTDKEQWPALTDGQVIDKMEVPAWGNLQTVYGGAVQVKISLGGMPLHIRKAYRIDLEQLVEFDRQHNLLGAMGNAPLLDYTIILDFPRQRFGVVR